MTKIGRQIPPAVMTAARNFTTELTQTTIRQLSEVNSVSFTLYSNTTKTEKGDISTYKEARFTAK